MYKIPPLEENYNYNFFYNFPIKTQNNLQFFLTIMFLYLWKLRTAHNRNLW